eukprot:COSAG02_NODE_28655_length_585_cov_1.059671_2_plen_45_part_01
MYRRSVRGGTLVRKLPELRGPGSPDRRRRAGGSRGKARRKDGAAA